jgi:hypothetical protein
MNDKLLASREKFSSVELVTHELHKLKGKDHLEDPFADGKLIFCYINERDQSV